MEYRYRRFTRDHLLEEISFRRHPGPGDPMPDFDLPTLNGERVRRGDFVGRRPLLLTFGSFTCPMTASAGPALKRLYAEFGDRVAFLTLYVREAHPGDNYPQPETFEQKAAFARAYKERDAIPWPVVVDDLEGTLHRSLDPKPNPVFLMDSEGAIAFRTLWANDARALRQGLEALVSGAVPAGDKQTHVVPMLSGMGKMHEVLSLAGPQAGRDVLRQAPPMYVLARLAAVFRPLPPLGRGLAATTVAALSGLALLGGLSRLWRWLSRS